MKKTFISLALLTFIIILLDFSGGKALHLLSDALQSKIDVGVFSINKPKGWFPAVVKENNTSRIFNVINERFLFVEASKHYFKYNKNGILLTRDGEKIIVSKLKNNEITRDYMMKYRFKDKDYLMLEKNDFTIVVDPLNEIMIVMSHLDKNIVYSMFNDKH